jgi:hypothetical protein
MPRPHGHAENLWYEYDYPADPPTFGLYENMNVRVVHVEGPLTTPIRPPNPEAAPGTMQDIPIDQDKATFTVEKQWPGRGQAVVPFREVTFPK